MSPYFNRQPQKESQPASSEISPGQPVIPSHPRQLLFTWLSKIPKLEPLNPGTTPEYPPTFIIGLGKTGKIVLEQITANLLERNLGIFPDAIKLMSIDESELESTENIDFVLLSRRPWFDWLRPFGNQPSPRALARVKFLLELQSRGQSRLYAALQRAAASFPALPRIFLVANLNEADSAFLWDIIFLLRCKVTEGSGSRWDTAPTSVFLACGLQNITPFDTGSDAFAVLRELSRFTGYGLASFKFPDPDLNGVSEVTLVDRCYLIDTYSSGKSGMDLTNEPLEEGIARVVSDALSILIDPQCATIDEELQNTNQSTNTSTKEYHDTYVSTIGAATFSLPLQELRRAVELRLIRNVLFGGDQSQPVGLYHVPYLWQISRGKQPIEENEAIAEALDFLRAETANHHPIFSELAGFYLGSNPVFPSRNIPKELNSLFAAKLAAWATDELNGAETPDLASRSNRLVRLKAIVVSLEQLLERCEILSNTPGKSRLNPNPTTSERIRSWFDITRKLEMELITWEDALAGAAPNDRISFRESNLSSNAGGRSLLKLVESDWLKSRQDLRDRASARVRRAPLSSGDDRPPYKGLEYPFYEHYICPELDETTQLSGNIIDKFISRIGWFCRLEAGEFNLNLVIVPPDIDFANHLNDASSPASPTAVTRRMFYDRGHINDAYGRLQDISSYYSRALLNEEIKPYLSDLGESEVALFLTGALYPLLPPMVTMGLMEDEIGNGGGDLDPPTERHNRYLISSDQRYADGLKGSLPLRVSYVHRNDPQTISVISFHHNLPLERTMVYENARRGYSQQPRAHVYTAEQVSARAETELRNQDGTSIYLEEGFVRLLQIGFRIDSAGGIKNIPLADLFLRCWLYRLLREEISKKEWVVPSTPSYEEVHVHAAPLTLWNGLRTFALENPCTTKLHTSHPLSPENIEGYSNQLYQVLKLRSETGRTGFLEQLRRLEKEKVDTLVKDSDPMVRSLGYYLKFLLEEERFGNF